MLVIPSSLVRANRSSSRAAPSSMEYSVWTWRWTKSPPLAEPDDMSGAVLLSGASGQQIRRSGRPDTRPGWTSWGKSASLRDHSPDPDRAHRQSRRTAVAAPGGRAGSGDDACGREHESDHRATVGPVGGAHPSAMCLGHRPDDGEPEPGPCVGSGAVELLEDQRQLARG